LSLELLLELVVISLSNSLLLASTSSSQVVLLRSSRRSVKKSVSFFLTLFLEKVDLSHSRFKVAKYPNVKTQCHSIDFSSASADYAALGKALDSLDVGVLSWFLFPLSLDPVKSY